MLINMQARYQWSLLWWSVVLLPLGVLMGLAVVGHRFLMIVLPIWACLFFCSGSWICGAVTLGAIIPVVCARRLMARMVADGVRLPQSIL
jgi:hypothetical protein